MTIPLSVIAKHEVLKQSEPKVIARFSFSLIASLSFFVIARSGSDEAIS
jgi:hypothetical protein